MNKKLAIRNSTVEFLIFQREGKEDGVQVVYREENIWCTQKAMAQLFDVGVPAISKHLKNVFESGELMEESVISKMETTATDGKNYNTTFYNLDAIISVGYRVNSVRATQFRQWCTSVLRQFAIRGYVVDKKRMENGSFIGEDYFEHLLAEIREIRLSERRFYQKLTDIYSTAIDYNRDAPTTRLFFKKVQNKIHYAVHGHTAAELIVERADADKETEASFKVNTDRNLWFDYGLGRGEQSMHSIGLTDIPNELLHSQTYPTSRGFLYPQKHSSKVCFQRLRAT